MCEKQRIYVLSDAFEKCDSFVKILLKTGKWSKNCKNGIWYNLFRKIYKKMQKNRNNMYLLGKNGVFLG